MADCISEGGVAEVYVELFRSDGAQQVRIQRTLENTRRDVEKLRGFYTSPNKLTFCNPSDDPCY